jgi:hypothetical protein
VILVVGSQKIVPDLDTAVRRVREHVAPYEDARLRESLGVGTRLARLLVTFLEARPGRTTVILAREPVGVWKALHTARERSPSPTAGWFGARDQAIVWARLARPEYLELVAPAAARAPMFWRARRAASADEQQR